MTSFSTDSQVTVVPFERRVETDLTTIGSASLGVFVSIPTEAVDILDALVSGSTVGEAAALFGERHGAEPDIEDFLAALLDAGLVLAPGTGQTGHTSPQAAPPSTVISTPVARRLASRPLLTLLTLLSVAGGVVATVAGGVPGPSVLVFRQHAALLSVLTFAIALTGLLIHELAHLVAARAERVPARIRIGHRLWFLVAETDMSAIWLVPRSRRYVALLAGPLVDAATAAVLIGLLAAAGHGWLAFSAMTRQLLGAALWTYLTRLLWQCFVFVRTDFYYVIATALDCKRLLGDTEDLLRNLVARARRRPAPIDQCALPAHERRAIRIYAGVWAIGRAAAVASLALVTVPVLGGYAEQVGRALAGAHSDYDFIDLATLATLSCGPVLAGLLLWLRGLHQTTGRKETRA